MRGRRIYHDEDGNFFADPARTVAVGTLSYIASGDYWQWAGGWAAKCPNGLHANLAKHAVTEHDDGTITVSPSILCAYDGKDGKKEYHGFLEHGVWRDC